MGDGAPLRVPAEAGAVVIDPTCRDCAECGEPNPSAVQHAGCASCAAYEAPADTIARLTRERDDARVEAKERAAIVAYLREIGENYGTLPARPEVFDIARRIEAGEHHET